MYLFIEFLLDHMIVAVDLYLPDEHEEAHADLDAWMCQSANRGGYAVHTFELEETR